MNIPQTDSIEELARFWDEHDLTDFEAELEEVPEPVFQREKEAVVQIRFRLEDFNMLNQVARTKGVEQTVLVREWVLEKLTNN
jgi:hypothetical protein